MQEGVGAAEECPQKIMSTEGLYTLGLQRRLYPSALLVVMRMCATDGCKLMLGTFIVST